MLIKAPEVDRIEESIFRGNTRRERERESHIEKRREMSKSPSKVASVPPQDQKQEEEWIPKGGSKEKLERRRNTPSHPGVGIPLPRVIFLVSLHLLWRILHHVQRYIV
jgi:hypothetical protein